MVADCVRLSQSLSIWTAHSSFLSIASCGSFQGLLHGPFKRGTRIVACQLLSLFTSAKALSLFFIEQSGPHSFCPMSLFTQLTCIFLLLDGGGSLAAFTRLNIQTIFASFYPKLGLHLLPYRQYNLLTSSSYC